MVIATLGFRVLRLVLSISGYSVIRYLASNTRLRSLFAGHKVLYFHSGKRLTVLTVTRVKVTSRLSIECNAFVSYRTASRPSVHASQCHIKTSSKFRFLPLRPVRWFLFYSRHDVLDSQKSIYCSRCHSTSLLR